MDFDDALRSHAVWKLKLRAFLAEPDHMADIHQAGDSHACALGHWIQGDGQKFAALPEFKRLCEQHSRFHKVAGDIVRRVQDGEKIDEHVMLGTGSAYDAASSGIFLALLDMKAKVGREIA